MSGTVRTHAANVTHVQVDFLARAVVDLVAAVATALALAGVAVAVGADVGHPYITSRHRTAMLLVVSHHNRASLSRIAPTFA